MWIADLWGPRAEWRIKQIELSPFEDFWGLVEIRGRQKREASIGGISGSRAQSNPTFSGSQWNNPERMENPTFSGFELRTKRMVNPVFFGLTNGSDWGTYKSTRGTNWNEAEKLWIVKLWYSYFMAKNIQTYQLLLDAWFYRWPHFQSTHPPLSSVGSCVQLRQKPNVNRST